MGKTCTPENMYLLSERKFMIIMLSVSVGLIVFLTLTEKRKALWPRTFQGYGALTTPLSFIGSHSKRLAYVSAFVMTSFKIMEVVVFGKYPLFPDLSGLSWTAALALKAFYPLCTMVIYALCFYPLFVCLTRDSLVSVIVATGYLICWLTLLYYSTVPNCLTYADIYMFAVKKIIGPIPMHLGLLLTMLYLLKRLIEEIYYLLKFRKIQKTEAEVKASPPQFLYIKLRLSRRSVKQGFLEEVKKTGLLRALGRKCYRNLPGFRYSTTILMVLSVGLGFVWVIGWVFILFVDILCMFFHQKVDAIFSGIENVSLYNITLANVVDDPFLLPLGLTAVILATTTIDRIAFYMRLELDIIQHAAYIACLISLCLILCMIPTVLKSYRRTLLNMYIGKYDKMPKFDHLGPSSVLASASRFAGYQVGYIFWGFLVQTLCFYLVFLVLGNLIIIPLKMGYTDIYLWIFNKFWPGLIVLVFLIIFQTIVTRFVFLQKDTTGIAIDNRRLYMIYNYFMFYFNCVIGIISCLRRIILSVVFGLILLPRLDKSILCRTFEHLDPGFRPFVCFLKLEVLHTHPILITFIHFVSTDIKRYKILRNIKKRSLHAASKVECTELKTVQMDASYNNDVGIWKGTMTEERKNKLRAKNRWFLAYTLLNNPELQILRKNYLMRRRSRRDQYKTEENKETEGTLNGALAMKMHDDKGDTGSDVRLIDV